MRLRKILGILVTGCLLALLVFPTITVTTRADTPWLSPDWDYRFWIEVTGSVDGALNPYQMILHVHAGAGTNGVPNADDVYLQTHAQADFDDVRITKSDGTTLIGIWQMEVNAGVDALYWVKWEDLPASPNTETFYIYFGNASAASASVGTDAWDYFEDMEADVNNFTDIGTPVRAQDDTQQVYGTYSMKTEDDDGGAVEGYSYGFVDDEYTRQRIIFWARPSQQNMAINITPSGPGVDPAGLVRFNAGANLQHYNGAWVLLVAYVANTWYKVEIVIDTVTDLFSVWIDDVNRVAGAAVTPAMGTINRWSMSMPVATVGSWYLDAMCIGEYTPNDPTYTDYGDLEEVGATPADGDWLDGSWLYRQQIVIEGTTDGAQAQYPMQFTVNYTSGTSSGVNIYLNSDGQPDFDDIRFTEADGISLIPYWVEEKTDYATAEVWIGFTNLVASPDNTDFYIYYGNLEAESLSNGHNTFTFFEDFEDADTGLDNLFIQGGQWGPGGLSIDTTQKVHGNSSVKITDASANHLYGFKYFVDTAEPWPIKYRFLWWERLAQTNRVTSQSVQDHRGIPYRDYDTQPSYDGPCWRFNSVGNIEYYPTGGPWTLLQAYAADTWYRMQNETDSVADTYDLYIDDNLRVNDGTFISALEDVLKLRIGTGVASSMTMWVDTLAAMPLATPAPTIGMYGLIEEIPAYTVSSNVASNVSSYSAVLNGVVTATEGAAQVDARFTWGVDTSFGFNTTWQTALDEDDEFTAEIPETGSLTPGQTYYYRAQIRDPELVVYSGEPLSFVALPLPPSDLQVTQKSVEDVTLSWTKGSGSTSTYIYAKNSSYPTFPGDGTLLYSGTESSATLVGLVNPIYYLVAYSYKSGVYSGSGDSLEVVMQEGAVPVPNTFEIENVMVFTNWSDDQMDDQLIVLSYKCIHDSGTPIYSPRDYFSVSILDGSTIKVQTKLPFWGYRPMGIWLDIGGTLEWGKDYMVEIVGLDSVWSDPPSTTFQMSSQNWKGEGLTKPDWGVFDEWVLTTASKIGLEENTLLTTLSSTDGEVLSAYGGQIFRDAIPGIFERRSELFYSGQSKIIPGDTSDPSSKPRSYADEMDLETRMGSDFFTRLANFGDTLDQEEHTIASLGFGLLVLMVLAVTVPFGGLPAALGAVALLGSAAAWTGIIELEILVVLALILISLFIWSRVHQNA